MEASMIQKSLKFGIRPDLGPYGLVLYAGVLKRDNKYRDYHLAF
jgi:hypothetical protein